MKKILATLFVVNFAALPALAQFSSDSTLDVVTWNIEWFGTDGNGPSNENLQLQNAAKVMHTLGSDLFALQEINGQPELDDLIDELNTLSGSDDYTGFVASHIDGAQRMAYVYDSSVIQLRALSSIIQGGSSFNWAQRLPYTMEFDYSYDGNNYSITAINIHAKAFSDEASYNRRVSAAADLHDYLAANRAGETIIFLGDYNDDVDRSIYNDEQTPYIDFVIDLSNYKILSKALSDARRSSTTGFGEMIDHITISDELFDFYVDGSVDLHEPEDYIEDYDGTTSDHYPVYANFQFGSATSADTELEIPDQITLSQNYPNPFNPVTNIDFSLNRSDAVTLEVYNLLGQRVASLIRNQAYSAGNHTISFDASSLSSGLYIYHLQTTNAILTRTMSLVK